MKTKTTTCRDENKNSLRAETIGELFALFEDAEANDVPFHVVYDAEEGGTVTISLGLNDLHLTRAAEALGFVVTRGGKIAENVYRGAESYLDCEEPHAVFAIKAWMHLQGARAGDDGGMAVEYQPEMLAVPSKALPMN